MKSDYNSQISQFLSVLRKNEVHISLDKDELVLNSKKQISAELIEELRMRKQELTEYLKSLQNETKEGAIQKVSLAEKYPASYSQRRFWILDQLSDGAIAYNMHSSYVFQGDLNVDALDHAFKNLIERHEILRTAFKSNENGEVFQIVHPVEGVSHVINEYDLRNYKEYHRTIRENIELPFDLSTGPSIRVSLFLIEENKWVLTYVLHHIAGDGWSLGVIINDLMKSYGEYLGLSNETTEVLPIQYKDFSSWQLDKIESDEGFASKEFWKNKLNGELPTIDLPMDFTRPAVKTFNGDHFQTEIEGENVNEFCKKEGVSLYMLFLGAFSVLLHKIGHQERLLVGSPIAGRNHSQLENQVGPYLNLIPQLITVVPNDSFQVFLHQVKESVLESFKHADYPFDKLIEDIDIPHDTSRNPLFDVLLSVQNLDGISGGESFDFGNLSISNYEEYKDKSSKFDLSLYIEESAQSISLKWEYNTDLFKKESIQRLSTYFTNLLANLIENPGEEIKHQHLLSVKERSEILSDFNDTAELVEENTIVSLVTNQVLVHPERTALIFEDKEYSYHDIDVCSNKLAHYFKEVHEVTEHTLVGIQLERSEWTVIAMLALMKLGAAYIPMDVTYPKSRVSYIKENSGLEFIFGKEELAAFKSNESSYSEAKLESVIAPDFSAYVIYTSGSTGNPKGVEVSHKNAVNFFAGMRNIFGDEPGTLLAVTNFTFDISILELLWTLTQGYTVVIQGETREITGSSDSLVSESKQLDFSLFYFGNSDVNQGVDKYELLMEGAKYADNNGYSAVWTPERHFHEFGGLYPNPSLLGSAIASITQYVDIRAGSVVAPLHHPLRIAEEWSVVDNLSNGRAGIALASGWQANDFVLNPENFKNRHQILFDSVDAIQSLWTGGSLELKDGNGTLRKTKIFPKPIQNELPMWVTSAGNIETFRSAGRKGLNVLTHLLGETLESIKEKIDAYRIEYGKHHPGKPEGKVTLMLHTYVGEDDDDVINNAKESFINYLRTSAGLLKNLAKSEGIDMKDVSFSDQDFEDLLYRAYDRFVQTASLIGTKDVCIQRLSKISSIGVDEIACLIDFGIDKQTVLNGLSRLSDVKDEYYAQMHQLSDYSVISQIKKHQVTHIQSTPSLARLLMEAFDGNTIDSLQTLILGGERLPRKLADTIFSNLPGVELYNMYGPTETTIWSTCEKVSPDEAITIGRPIVNTQVYLLDENLEPVAIGSEGEIYIGGEGVTKGYINNQDLTNSVFVENPFIQDKIMYRTGDFGRFLSDGRIEFKGRKDDQLKISGYRIELGEIENTLVAHEGIEKVIALFDEQKQVIVAFYTSKEKRDAQELKQFLMKALPSYMVPNQVIHIEAFPLMINGKVDRKKLLEETDVSSETEYVAPRNEIEEQLVEIWSEILNISKIGVYHNYFELGGNSIKTIQLITRINQFFGVKLGIQSVFDGPTIDNIAVRVSFLKNQKEIKNKSEKLVEIEL